MSTLSTFATTVPTKPRRASATADSVIAAAIDIAREAALDVAGGDDVGEHDGVRAEGQRLATHYFRSTAPGYRGWRWAVTMARAPRAKAATVCEVSLLSGEDSILAPPWMPWSERLQPGDVGREDVLPFSPDDARLMQGFEATGDVDVDELAIVELGLGRPRVLSPEGRAEATTRWYNGDHGPIKAPTGGQSARGERRDGPLKAQCSTCGFLMLMAGSVRTVFGVCSNEWSPDDGRVVSMDHGCGAHSETDVKQTGSDWPDKAPVIDEHAVELFDHTADEAAAEAGVPEAAADAEILRDAEATTAAAGDAGAAEALDAEPAAVEPDGAQADEAQPLDAQPDEAQAEGAETGEIQPEDAEAGEVRPEGADAGEVRPEDAETGEVRPEGADAGEVQPEGADAGEVQPEDAETGEVQPEGADAGEVRPEDAETSELRPEGADAGEVQPEDAEQGAAQPDPDYDSGQRDADSVAVGGSVEPGDPDEHAPVTPAETDTAGPAAAQDGTPERTPTEP